MSESRLTLDLGDRSYPILIGTETWASETLSSLVEGRRALIVTNETVAPLYLNQLQESLAAGRCESLVLPDGERYKTMETLNQIFDSLLERRFDRSGLLIALGGGVVGDITGFAAACYQRGIDFVQIPTTLLSQVDSSVGGKTAVNHPRGKNMIGAFYQPRAVCINVQTLDTLHDREFSAGMAEVIKYGLIRDARFFDWLEVNMDGLMKRDRDLLIEAIQISCATKAAVVAEDETEQDVRAILNLGHTFGHAIEAAQNFRGLLHGEAVGAGMAMAARLSARLGKLEADAISRIEAVLMKAGLPCRAPHDLDAAQLRDLMSHDKKVSRGQLRLILLNAIGEACIESDFEEVDLMAVLQQG